jgi:ribosomal protein L24E
MSSKRVVMFINDNTYFLEGFRETKNHIRGRVINGAGTLYILKDGKLCWRAYAAGNRSDCTQANLVSVFNPGALSWLEVPEVMFGDYNVVINWAQARRKREEGGLLPQSRGA